MEITVIDTRAYVITEDKLREGLEEKFGDGGLVSEEFRNYCVSSLLRDYKELCYDVVTSHRKPYLETEWEVEEVA